MTTRDRSVLIAIAIIAVLAGTWMLVVSPERKKASDVNAQVTAARTQLNSASGELAASRAAEAKYTTAYASLVSLGKAVPVGYEVPSLILQLSVASHQKNVDFASIVATTGSSSGSSSSTTANASAGLTQMPFTFVFNGGFFDLERLFSQLTALTKRTPTGALRVSGRLLTIQSVKLAPASGAGVESSKGSTTQLTGTVTATAYVLPASQGVSTSSSPGGATPAASTTGASGTPTAPAIVRVGP
jgi:Tfp pilus assembly protein PilO